MNDLFTLKQAAASREAANETYLRLVFEALESYSVSDVAKAAGVSRQAVYALLKRKSQS